MKLSLMAGTTPFAHLLRNRPAPAKTAAGKPAAGTKADDGDTTDDEKKDKDVKGKAKGKGKADDGDGSDDGDANDLMEEKSDEGEDELNNGDEGDGGDGEDDEADEKEVDTSDDKQKDAKKAKGNGATSSPAEHKAFARGRRAERERCAAIFKSPHAGVNPAAAAHLAFETSMSAENAVGTLAAFVAAAPASAAKAGLQERMSKTANPTVGASTEGGAEPDMAQQILAAGRKRRGETA